MDQPLFVLKTTPPRAHRTALVRERLTRIWNELRDRSAIAICAPGGFGKTTLLAQWRRLWLESGSVVAWLTLDARDDPARFARGLLHAMREASGRAVFETIAAQAATQPQWELEALTSLLSEIANLARPTVLMLDDAERLPETTAHESLAYLIHNAPANLVVVVGSRKPLAVSTIDLAAHGRFAMLKVDDLRFSLDESMQTLRKRFGERMSLDDCARLHEVTEGWPIGLQLAAAAIERERDLHAAIESLSGRHGDIERYFVDSLLSRLAPEHADFLTRVSILDTLVPELCETVAGTPELAADLRLFLRDTPILMAVEGHDWGRLHPLARDFFQGLFEKLPQGEREEAHRRAARWLAAHDLFHAAARHALACGDAEEARTFAKRCLWSLVLAGELGEAGQWLDWLPKEVFEQDPRLRLVGGWILALVGRGAQARQEVEDIARDSSSPPDMQYEAMLIAAAAGGFTDRPGQMPGFVERWPQPPQSVRDPVLAFAQANMVAAIALWQGNPERARRIEDATPRDPKLGALPMTIGIGHEIVGLSHLWEGQPVKAEAALRPDLERAERELGRRSVVAGMYASILAAALFERDQPHAAMALLANRLDVIERSPLQDSIIHAYRTVAYAALAAGDERRALDVLENLHALGETRHVPRMLMTSLAERVRIHALRSRGETVAAHLEALDALEPVFADADYAMFAPLYQLSASIAKSYAALARFDGEIAAQQLRQAGAIATRIHRGREALVVKVLRAVLAHHHGREEAGPLLAEALGLAALAGLDRLAADTHPVAVELARKLGAGEGGRALRAESAPEPAHAAPRDTAAAKASVAPGGILTPKESEILQLLHAGMSRKAIARTMDISDETVKWHLKNLFAKLGAGTSKHAVDRARLFGLLTA